MNEIDKVRPFPGIQAPGEMDTHVALQQLSRTAYVAPYMARQEAICFSESCNFHENQLKLS